MKSMLQSIPLWFRIMLVAYLIHFWLVDNGSSSREAGQQIVLDEPLELSGRPTLGREDAPVSIVIFSDFQCVHCRDFDREVLPRLEREFVETGKAKITFLHYPFMSEDSYRAALAAECVYQQKPEAFWEFKSAVFELQRPPRFRATANSLSSVAKNVSPNLNATELATCLLKESSEESIERDERLGKHLGVKSVPLVLVNSHGVSPSYQAILEEINKQNISE